MQTRCTHRRSSRVVLITVDVGVVLIAVVVDVVVVVVVVVVVDIPLNYSRYLSPPVQHNLSTQNEVIRYSQRLLVQVYAERTRPGL
jgi:uncharacterized membrane protein